MCMSSGFNEKKVFGSCYCDKDYRQKDETEKKFKKRRTVSQSNEDDFSTVSQKEKLQFAFLEKEIKELKNSLYCLL